MCLSLYRGYDGRRLTLLLFLVLVVLLPPPPLFASIWGAEDLTSYHLEELMDLQVTSATRNEKTVAQTSSAIFVITAEDIQRAAVSNLPDLFRTVPGLMVARITANRWAVSSRSFNSLWSDKLLVLVNGRDTYGLLFPTTDWSVITPPLEDIERIEIIRGPAATLWGANAVNGVINIISKPARMTQGTFVSAATGNILRDAEYLRYGGALGEYSWWRGSYDHSDYRGGSSANEDVDGDDWRRHQGSLRLDVDPPGEAAFFVDGRLYSGEFGFDGIAVVPVDPYVRPIRADESMKGGHIQVGWTPQIAGAQKLTLHSYYDRTTQDSPRYSHQLDTFNLDMQHNVPIGAGHNLVSGLGYRYTHSDMGSSFAYSVSDEDRKDQRFSAFVQDEIDLLSQRLTVTIGSRFENSPDIGTGWSPNLRLLYAPNPELSFWSAVSRAVRTPSRFEREMTIYSSRDGSTIGRLEGTTGFEIEKVTTAEIGSRAALTPAIDCDVTLFYNRYDDLRSFAITGLSSDPAFTPAQPVINGNIGNAFEGFSYGAELALQTRPVDDISVDVTYSYFRISLKNPDDPNDPFTDTEEGKSPRHQASLKTGAALTANTDLNLTWRYVDQLRRDNIPAYLELDARIDWRPVKGMTLSLFGENLLDSQHPEFASERLTGVLANETQRSLTAKISWAF